VPGQELPRDENLGEHVQANYELTSYGNLLRDLLKVQNIDETVADFCAKQIASFSSQRV